MAASWKPDIVYWIIYHLTDPVLKGLIIAANEYAGHIRAEHITNHWGKDQFSCLSGPGPHRGIGSDGIGSFELESQQDWGPGVGGWLSEKTPRSKGDG